MTLSKLIGILFLVSSVFLLTQSLGWKVGYVVLSGGLAFSGLLLLVRRRPHCSRDASRRIKSAVRAPAAGGLRRTAGPKAATSA